MDMFCFLGEVIRPCFLVENHREKQIAGQGENNHNIHGLGLLMEVFMKKSFAFIVS